MEQSNLLELARRGNPEAIAALMNAVLESKGIRAQATLENDCLHVLLESAKSLNQVTITNFIQRGLLELEIPSIRKVRASGKKLNEKKIAWTREFSLAVQSAERVAPVETFVPPVEPVTLQANQDTIASQAPSTPVVAEPEALPTVAELPPQELPQLAEIESLQTQLLPPDEEEIDLPPHLLLDLDAEEPEEFDLPLPEHLLLSEDPEEETLPEQNVQDENLELQDRPINLAIRTSLRHSIAQDIPDAAPQDEPEEEAEEDDSDEVPTNRWKRLAYYSRSYALPVLLVGIGSFFAGGTAAFLSTSQTPQSKMDEVMKAKNDTPEVKQKEAEDYLKAMNTAQEKFYKDNNRFASSLEELERSANLISQSYSYAYRLKVSDRSVITAAPRESGLKSYVGAVFLSQSGAPSTVICQTKKPSMEAPLTPEFSQGKANCDPRSAKLP